MEESITALILVMARAVFGPAVPFADTMYRYHPMHTCTRTHACAHVRSTRAHAHARTHAHFREVTDGLIDAMITHSDTQLQQRLRNEVFND